MIRIALAAAAAICSAFVAGFLVGLVSEWGFRDEEDLWS